VEIAGVRRPFSGQNFYYYFGTHPDDITAKTESVEYSAMRNGNRFAFLMMFAFVTVLALALGKVVTPARAAIPLPTNQAECEAAGGWWFDAGYVDVKVCYIPVSLVPGICPGAEYLAVFVSIDSVYCPGVSLWAKIGSPGADCILDGGLWQGDTDGLNGKCIYPDGTPDALAACGPGFDLVFTLAAGVVTGQKCAAPGQVSLDVSRVPGFGRFGSFASGQSGGGTLSLSGGKNGSVTFDPGTCSGKCTLGPNLPGGALASLPADAIAWLYFKTVDEDGNPGTGTYTVCFDVGDLTSPVIYRYVSGAWVAQPVTISGGQICATASGDGAFALGGS
jgi:hypothetical protein